MVIEIKKPLSIKEYVDEIKPYMKYIINNLKQSDIWKIQLTSFAINVSCYEELVIHSKSDNIEIMIYDKASLNESKQKKMALSSSNGFTCIIKMNNVKICFFC